MVFIYTDNIGDKFMNLWGIEKNGFEIADIEKHGSKYLIGNGFMGYRGTMEEYSAEQLVAVNLAGFFDLAENPYSPDYIRKNPDEFDEWGNHIYVVDDDD